MILIIGEYKTITPPLKTYQKANMKLSEVCMSFAFSPRIYSGVKTELEKTHKIAKFILKPSGGSLSDFKGWWLCYPSKTP